MKTFSLQQWKSCEHILSGLPHATWLRSGIFLALAGFFCAWPCVGQTESSGSPDHVKRVDFIHYVGKPTAVKKERPDCYNVIGFQILNPKALVINPSNSGWDEKFVVNTILDAVAVWNHVSAARMLGTDYTIDYNAPFASDGLYVIMFQDMGMNGILAFASVSFTEFGGELLEADMVFNTAYPWGDATKDANVYDFLSVAIHELGHWVGLSDLFDDRCSGVTMYSRTEIGDITKRTLSIADKRGIREIYPPGK